MVSVRAAKDPKGPRLAIVGVTGAVGQEFLQVRARAALLHAAACGPLPAWWLLHPEITVTSCMKPWWSKYPVPAASGACCSGQRWFRQGGGRPINRRSAKAQVCSLPPPFPPPQVITERKFPYSSIKLLASARCAPRSPSDPPLCGAGQPAAALCNAWQPARSTFACGNRG